MKIILHPAIESDNLSLRILYDRAISEAKELFIVTAYLTDWKPKSVIQDYCEELSFIVGTDFGITRKEACKSVLKWLPKTRKTDFRAADGISGFHPKLVLWKNKEGECSLVLGSSNLTQAAFSTNYEANILSNISLTQYNAIKEWIYSIRSQCSPISEDWLKSYIEIKPPKAGGKKIPVVSFKLPFGKYIEDAIRERRIKRKAFTKIKSQIETLIHKCSDGEISNTKFYEELMNIWGHHESRIQSSGFERKGKDSNWKQVCTSLWKIITKSSTLSEVALDNLVREEIDRLASAGNPTRGAWLSEMLCQFFPNKYPLLNKPVKFWLQYNKYKAPINSSEGAKYIDLAIKLRNALRGNKANSAKNLAQLDQAIWTWYEKL